MWPARVSRAGMPSAVSRFAATAVAQAAGRQAQHHNVPIPSRIGAVPMSRNGEMIRDRGVSAGLVMIARA